MHRLNEILLEEKGIDDIVSSLLYLLCLQTLYLLLVYDFIPRCLGFPPKRNKANRLVVSDFMTRCLEVRHQGS